MRFVKKEHPPTHPPIHTPTHIYIHILIQPSIHTSAHQFIHLSIHPYTHLSTHLPIHPSTHQSSISQLIHPLTHPLIYHIHPLFQLLEAPSMLGFCGLFNPIFTWLLLWLCICSVLRLLLLHLESSLLRMNSCQNLSLIL